MERNIKSEIYLTIEEFKRGATKDDFFESVNRELEIADMKQFYTKSQLVPRHCSEEEYDSIEASTDYRDMVREQGELA